MFKYLKLAAGVAAIIAAGSLSYAAGYFPNFPIVGQSSYCASFVTGTTGQICGQTVPAGPATLAGTEYFLVDVSPTTAGPPQTVSVPLAGVGGLPTVYVTAWNGGTLAMSPGQGGIQYIGNGTVTTATLLTLPAANYNGQTFNLSSNVTLGVLTLSAPTGYSLTNNPIGLTPIVAAAGQTQAQNGYAWKFRQSDQTWYRIF